MEDYETTRLLQGGFDYLICKLRVLMPAIPRTWQSIEAIRLWTFFVRILCLLRRALFGKDAGAPRMSGVTHVGPRWDRNAKSGTTEHMIDGNGPQNHSQSLLQLTNGEPNVVNEREMATLNCVDCLLLGS